MSDKLKLVSILGYSALMWVFTSVAMYIGKEMDMSLGIYLGLLVVSIVSIIIAYMAKNVIVSVICSVVVPATLGLSVAPLMNRYVNEMGGDVVFVVFLGATGIFVLAGLFGYFTTANLGAMGNYLFFALLAVIMISILGIFVGFGEGIYAIIAAVSLVIFTLYTAHDINQIKHDLPHIEAYDIPLRALDLYLDLFNMFLDLLRLVSYFTKD